MKTFKLLFVAWLTVVIFPLGRVSLSGRQEEQAQPAHDEGMTVTSYEEMGYPLAALWGREEGVVVIQLKLDDNGKVISAIPISGYDLLVPSALANARKWRFNTAVSKTAVIVYQFRFADGECGPTLGQLFVFQKPNIASVVACPKHWQPDSK